MQPTRILLLVTLLFVLVAVAVALLSDSPGESAPPPGPIASESGSGAGADFAAADEFNQAIKKTLLLIVGGVAAAILLFSFVLPFTSDWIATRFNVPDEGTAADLKALASACITDGDFEGAIDAYRKLMDRDPPDRFPVVEIAMLYIEHLDNPQAAIEVLEKSVNDKDWEVDDAAFLKFRIASIELENRKDPLRAREVLELIAREFEGTRHAANAEHRIEEIDSGTSTAGE